MENGPGFKSLQMTCQRLRCPAVQRWGQVFFLWTKTRQKDVNHTVRPWKWLRGYFHFVFWPAFRGEMLVLGRVSYEEGSSQVVLWMCINNASTMHQHWVEMGMSTSSLENTPHKNEFPLTCAHWHIFVAPDFKTHALSCWSITTLVDNFCNKADNIRIVSTTSPGI